MTTADSRRFERIPPDDMLGSSGIRSANFALMDIESPVGDFLPRIWAHDGFRSE